MSLESHSAPGPAAGYIFQFERALYWLAQSPAGFCVGIETSDDVTIESEDGSLVLEQDKHSIQESSEPFGDRSKDLWNTLSTWVSALEEGELELGKSGFLMVTNKALPECVAKLISRAKTESEIDDCIEALKQAAEEPSETIRPFAEKILAPTCTPQLRWVIENCELLDETGEASGAELREATIAQLQIPEDIAQDSDSIVNELHGWVSSQALRLWQKRERACVSRNSFVNQFHAVLDRRKRQRSRERAAHLIPVVDEQLGQERGRDFVKQICLVTEEDIRIEESIREFVRCNIEKSRLSTEGNITDQDWIDFEESLKLRWRKIFSREKRLSKHEEDADIGFKILTETTDDYKEALAGVDTEQVYLTSGTYHRMADRLTVGWHPDFENLMKQNKE